MTTQGARESRTKTHLFRDTLKLGASSVEKPAALAICQASFNLDTRSTVDPRCSVTISWRARGDAVSGIPGLAARGVLGAI